MGYFILKYAAGPLRDSGNKNYLALTYLLSEEKSLKIFEIFIIHDANCSQTKITI